MSASIRSIFQLRFHFFILHSSFDDAGVGTILESLKPDQQVENPGFNP